MLKKILGSIIKYRGLYQQGETYYKENLVKYNDMICICKVSETTNSPMNETDWDIFIPRGLKGEQGPPGPQGPQGELGPAGNITLENGSPVLYNGTWDTIQDKTDGAVTPAAVNAELRKFRRELTAMELQLFNYIK